MGLGLMDIHRFGGKFHAPSIWTKISLLRTGAGVNPFVPVHRRSPHAPIMILEHEARLDIQFSVMEVIDSHLRSSILPEEPSQP